MNPELKSSSDHDDSLPPPPKSSVPLGTINKTDISNTSSCQILPPMSIGAGNYDRAWNDPPVFSHEINLSSKSGATKLNKRVPFPGLSSSSSPQVLSNVNDKQTSASNQINSGPYFMPPQSSNHPPT